MLRWPSMCARILCSKISFFFRICSDDDGSSLRAQTFAVIAATDVNSRSIVKQRIFLQSSFPSRPDHLQTSYIMAYIHHGHKPPSFLTPMSPIKITLICFVLNTLLQYVHIVLRAELLLFPFWVMKINYYLFIALCHISKHQLQFIELKASYAFKAHKQG